MSPIPYFSGQPDISVVSVNSTNGTNTTEPYLYLEEHFSLMILTGLLLAASAVIGTLGNFLIIFAVCFVKSLRTTGNVFVVNLALADMVVTMFIDPFNVVGAVAGRSVLMHDSTLCDWIGSFCGPACMSSMWNMCAISLNRYVLICKPHLYSKIYTFPRTIAMCVGIWVLAHLLHSPNHFGWGHTRFNTEYYICTFDIVTHSYAIFYIMTGVVIPLVGVLYGYAFIFKRVRSVKVQLRQHQQAVFAHGSQQEEGKLAAGGESRSRRPKKPGFTQDDVKLAKTLFAAFIVFLICWLPFAIFVVAHQPKAIPGWIYMIAIIMAHGNSAVNPILYGCANEKFREGYRNVLGLSRQVGPDATQGKNKKIHSIDNANNFTMTGVTERSGNGHGRRSTGTSDSTTNLIAVK